MQDRWKGGPEFFTSIPTSLRKSKCNFHQTFSIDFSRCIQIYGKELHITCIMIRVIQAMNAICIPCWLSSRLSSRLSSVPRRHEAKVNRSNIHFVIFLISFQDQLTIVRRYVCMKPFLDITIRYCLHWVASSTIQHHYPSSIIIMNHLTNIYSIIITYHHSS